MPTSRRSFLQMLAGGAAVALAPAVRFIPALEPTVEKLTNYSFHDIVIDTLRAAADKIRDNVLQHNALFQMLKEREKQ